MVIYEGVRVIYEGVRVIYEGVRVIYEGVRVIVILVHSNASFNALCCKGFSFVPVSQPVI